MARSSSNFSILAEVELDTSTIQKQLNSLGSKIKFDSTTLKDAQKSMDDLGNSAEKAGDKVADTALNFNAANEIFQNTLDIIGSMVDQVYELDSALTEFKKVSDLQGQALQNYQNHLADLGSTVGRTTSEMVEAATEFRKNGFNDEDAAQLGQLATLYQNVADEAISAGESASFLIAQMTAFDIDASNADHIVDAVNEVRVWDLAKQGELLEA